LIPEWLEDWDLQTLNKLVTMKDIERESFDFKGPEFQDFSAHCHDMGRVYHTYPEKPLRKWRGDKFNQAKYIFEKLEFSN